MLNKIRIVEIEINSFCNRKCVWCPNSKIDRSTKKRINQNIFKSLLFELKDNNYSGFISFSRYNEPFADIDYLEKCTKLCKDILPNVKLVSNTNGDYLSHDNIKRSKIDDITIMDYDCRGLNYCINRLQELGASIASIDYPYIKANIDNITILYYVDWPKLATIEDRGGSLSYNLEFNNQALKWKCDAVLRDRPCYEPIYFVGVDFNGNVTPCCHIRSDNDYHKDYILGNLCNQSLFEIYNNFKAIDFRLKTSCNDSSNYPYPCKHCQKDAGRHTRNNPGIDF